MAMRIYRVILGVLLFAFLVWAFLYSRNWVLQKRSNVVPVTLHSSNSWELKGDFYKPLNKGEKAPGLLLLPTFNESRTSYVKTAPFFQKKGYAVLTLDLRGIGESKQKNAQEVPNLKGIEDDIAVGLDYLSGQKGVDANRVGILAASTVCNAAVHTIDHRKNIRAVVLLSGQYDSTATALLTSPDFPPSLIVASYDDKIAIRNAVKIRDRLPDDSKNQVKLFLNAGHGLQMFWSMEGEALGNLVLNWFQKYLETKPVK